MIPRYSGEYNLIREICRLSTEPHEVSWAVFYYDTRTNGEILSVITNDVESVNTAIGKNLYNTVR